MHYKLKVSIIHNAIIIFVYVFNIAFNGYSQIKMECAQIGDCRYWIYIKNDGANPVYIPDFMIVQQSNDTMFINERFNFSEAKCKEYQYKLFDSIYSFGKPIRVKKLISEVDKATPMPFDNPICKFELLSTNQEKEVIIYHKDFCEEVKYISIGIRDSIDSTVSMTHLKYITYPVVKSVK